MTVPWLEFSDTLADEIKSVPWVEFSASLAAAADRFVPWVELSADLLPAADLPPVTGPATVPWVEFSSDLLTVPGPDLRPNDTNGQTTVVVDLSLGSPTLRPYPPRGSTFVALGLTVRAAPVVDLGRLQVNGWTFMFALNRVRTPVVVELAPAPVAGRAQGFLEISVRNEARPLLPVAVSGRTAVQLVQVVPVYLEMDSVYSQNETTVDLTRAFRFEMDDVRGSTVAYIAAGELEVAPDGVQGQTSVVIGMRSQGVTRFLLDKIVGSTSVAVLHFPDLATNTPILMALTMSASLESVEMVVSE